MKDGFPVSVAELLAAGEWPLPSEAVAIVLDVCQQVLRQPAGGSVLPAISTGTLFVDGSGTVAVAGGVPVEDDQTVQLLGRLLLQMLPAASVRVPARLRLLATRAAAGDPPRLSVERFAAGLRGFGPAQPRAAIRGVFDRWRAADGRHREGHADARPADGRHREGHADARPAGGDRRQAGPGPDVLRRLLREADEGAYLAGLEQAETAADASHEAADTLTPVADAQETSGSGSSGDGRRRRRRAARIGFVAFALLLVVGVGAAYWLNADEVLPPLPMNPTILIDQPPPRPRGGWELLSDPAGLAVKAAPDPRDATSPAVAGRSQAPSVARRAPAPARSAAVDGQR